MTVNALAGGFRYQAIIWIAFHYLFYLASWMATLVVASGIWTTLHLLFPVPADAVLGSSLQEQQDTAGTTVGSYLLSHNDIYSLSPLVPVIVCQAFSPHASFLQTQQLYRGM
jgi:hypothetical protein